MAYEDIIAQMTLEEKCALLQGASAFGTFAIPSLGIPELQFSDGPHGMRHQDPETANHLGIGGSLPATCFPTAATVAQSWDPSLGERLGEALGEEAACQGVGCVLGPGLNIKRSPLTGRNFEYFSEDPLASGRMAATVVRGLQSAGISACPKHFACNNQEMRRNTSDSRVSEQALREIYLRGFQICVREAQPDFVMTSYNKVNGAWAHYNYDLATTVLRNEWGFEGVVITDWWMKPARSPEFPDLQDNAYRLRAGVDVLMPGSMSHMLLVRSKARNISRGELQQSARRVLKYLLHRKME